MENDQWHSWGKITVLAIVIIFSCGGYAIQVNNNTKGIGSLETEVGELKEDVHVLELSDKDIANLAQKSVDFMVKIDSSLTFIRDEQTKQATMLAVNSIKLETLTKGK